MTEQERRGSGADVTEIHTGGITGEGIAIGPNAQAIVNNVNNHIHELSQVEEGEKAWALEQQRLAEGVAAYASTLGKLVEDKAGALGGGPYRGLISYTIKDTELFFGRRRALQELDEPMQKRLTVLQSESGAGKSSLLNAGVIPRLLENNQLPLVLRAYDRSPDLAVRRHFVADLDKTPELAAAPLRDFLRQVTQSLGTDTTLFLILDQFEEFFTLLGDETQRAFVNELAECLEDETLNVRWLLALRSEFFGDLATFRPRIRNPFENDYRLSRLTTDEAYKVITEPVKPFGVEIESSLVDQLLKDLQHDDEILPAQVQLICKALYSTLRDQQTTDSTMPSRLTLAMYQAENGIEGILRGHLNRVLRRTLQTDSERELARNVLVNLISSNRQRKRLAHSELSKQIAATLLAVADLDNVLAGLIDERLITAEKEDEDDEATYELAHDYLLNEIRIDPAVQAQKLAQELLDQEALFYVRHGTLLSPDKFEIINRMRSGLVLDNTRKALFKQSEDAIHAEEVAREEAQQRELKHLQDLTAEAEARVQEETKAKRNMQWLLGAATLALALLAVLFYVFYGEYQDAKPHTLLGEARKLKEDLEAEKAIGKLDEAKTIADKRGVDLGISYEAERNEILRYVATKYTERGEDALRIARQSQEGDENEQRLESAVETATAHFATALRHKPPSDAHVYVKVPAVKNFEIGDDCIAEDKDDDDEKSSTCDQPKQTIKEMDEFWIMRTEVTNSQYGTFLDITKEACADLDIAKETCADLGITKEACAETEPTKCYKKILAPHNNPLWADDNNPRWKDEDYAQRPVVGVTSIQARAYAKSIGGRLPTEAEWERVCTGDGSNGNGEGRNVYPYGTEMPDDDDEYLNRYRINIAQSNEDRAVNVGSSEPAQNQYGLYELAGNVREWTNTEPNGDDVDMGIRGGSFSQTPNLMRCSNRESAHPSTYSRDLGFRVVLSSYSIHDSLR